MLCESTLCTYMRYTCDVGMASPGDSIESVASGTSKPQNMRNIGCCLGRSSVTAMLLSLFYMASTGDLSSIDSRQHSLAKMMRLRVA